MFLPAPNAFKFRLSSCGFSIAAHSVFSNRVSRRAHFPHPYPEELDSAVKAITNQFPSTVKLELQNETGNRTKYNVMKRTGLVTSLAKNK